MVSYTPRETSTNTAYLKNDSVGNGTGVSRTATLDFQENNSNSKWEASITIETNDDNNMDNPNGVIEVELDSPSPIAGYLIGTDPNDRITINVKDATVPTITIADAPSITATQTAEFTLTANPQPWQALAIRYTPTEIGSSFLAPAAGTSGTPTVITPSITFAPPSEVRLQLPAFYQSQQFR